MPETEQETSRERTLLILVTEAAELKARLRSRDRDVRRWVAHEPASPAEFTGDPTSAACYEWTRDAAGVTAVIDLEPVERARAALAAVRAVRSDAAVMVLSAEAADIDGDSDGTLARAGDLRDVVRLDLDEELERLEAERRAHCLRRFAEGSDIVPILIHDDPDPDAVSSALGVAMLLGGSPERTPIVTLDEIRRPENRRMADLLRIRVTRVTREELRRFDRVITVDTQPRDLQQDGQPRFAVIDHHPPESSYTADFLDIRPSYGATATMLTEYLRARGPRDITRTLATALLFGIKTDTDSLTRGVSPPDALAYAYLQARADLQLVRRFERPSYTRDTARRFGAALANASQDDDLCIAYLEDLPEADSHMLADLADFCLGIEHVTWVVVGALIDDELVLTIRHAGGERPGAGSLARALAASGGSGGGHKTMARVNLPAARLPEALGNDASGDVVAGIRRLVRRTIDGLECDASRPALHPAPQA